MRKMDEVVRGTAGAAGRGRAGGRRVATEPVLTVSNQKGMNERAPGAQIAFGVQLSDRRVLVRAETVTQTERRGRRGRGAAGGAPRAGPD